ncbi:Phytocyanin domain-containing protein [Psidium guajava]|nr:Phytocyanin domain-containing protein [Psidium guajava]
MLGSGEKLAMVVAVLVVLVVMGSGVEGREPTLHRVGGGKNTWAPNVNFTDWSSHEHFHVGDWLYFGFDKTQYNVLEVNKTSYDKCIDTGFITNVTRGGRDVFNLTEAKPYYFISGRGYCFNGMKLAVNVTVTLPPPSPDPPKKGGSPCSVGDASRRTILLSLLAAAFLFCS